MGSMINLPVINYYEHATFFTGGHAHGAMFGVKGNIALASILYCVQHVVEPEDWCPNLVRTAFWSMNGGIALMMVLSMLPTGLYQFYQNIHYGMWYARSGVIVEDEMIQNLAKMRSVHPCHAKSVVERWMWLWERNVILVILLSGDGPCSCDSCPLTNLE